MKANERRTSRAVALAALLLVGSFVAVAAPAASHVQVWFNDCQYEYTVDTPKVHRHNHECSGQETDAVNGAADRVETVEFEEVLI